jgi:hypothetical protein
MTAPQVAPLRQMPLDEEIKGLNCRTGNYSFFHFFQLKHCLPESADLISIQNFDSRRLACSLSLTFFLVLICFTSLRVYVPGCFHVYT